MVLHVSGIQVLAHAVGDYVLQSDEVANEKTKRTSAALLHVALYGLAFWVLTGASWKAMVFVVGSHFVIDRWRLARHVGWAKNWLGFDAMRWLLGWRTREVLVESENSYGVRIRVKAEEPMPRPSPWKECQGTGYPLEKPPFMAVWLMIIVDQCLHVACNALAMQLWP
jgi:hypothetical protein